MASAGANWCSALTRRRSCTSSYHTNAGCARRRPAHGNPAGPFTLPLDARRRALAGLAWRVVSGAAGRWVGCRGGAPRLGGLALRGMERDQASAGSVKFFSVKGGQRWRPRKPRNALLIGLLTNSTPTSLAQLTLSPVFTRGHHSLYRAVAGSTFPSPPGKACPPSCCPRSSIRAALGWGAWMSPAIRGPMPAPWKTGRGPISPPQAPATGR